MRKNASTLCFVVIGIACGLFTSRKAEAQAIWSQLSGCAWSIAGGGSWIVGCDNWVSGQGYPIYKWINGAYRSDPAWGRGQNITVDLNSTPWIVNNAGH